MSSYLFTIGNGGGSCKTLEDVEALCGSAATDIEIGSVTPRARAGNSGQTYYSLPDGTSLNAIGLANPGVEVYTDAMFELVSTIVESGKRAHINVAGFDSVDYVHHYLWVVKELCVTRDCEISSIILNIGCPNTDAAIISYRPEIVEDIITGIKKMRELHEIKDGPKVFMKVSPVFDTVLLDELADAILLNEIVDGIQIMNTVPNAFAFNRMTKPVITPNAGLAGLGGTAVFPIMLGQLVQWKEQSTPNVELIALGGISTGRQAYEALQLGASGIRVTTAFLERGPIVFHDIMASDEMGDVLDSVT